MSIVYHDPPVEKHYCLLAAKPFGTIAECSCGAFYECTHTGWRVLARDSPIVLAILRERE